MKILIRPTLFMALILTLFAACREKDETGITANPPVTTPVGKADEPTTTTKTIVTGYEIIWGMDFLPNGDLLFTEKRGKLYRFAGGTTTEITGLTTDINATGQGGLMDLRVHPNYTTNGWVYATYSSSPSGSKATQLNLIRFKINADKLVNTETIFRTSATNTWQGHYGGRIEFDRAGLLYLSVGEGGPGSYGGATAPNQNGQNVKTEWGKIHRMTDSGGIPADNPVLPGNTAATTIFSYGHRNPQGLILNPTSGQLWETEHGPRGGDEVNIVEGGKNYGWPLVSYGVNYDGKPVSASPTMPGVQAPIHTWTPSIGACGMAFITNDKFKAWKGNLVAGSLALTHLNRLEISNNTVVRESRLLDGQGRVRNVKQGPDGNLYVSLEGPGRILQLSPQ